MSHNKTINMIVVCEDKLFEKLKPAFAIDGIKLYPLSTINDKLWKLILSELKTGVDFLSIGILPDEFLNSLWLKVSPKAEFKPKLEISSDNQLDLRKVKFKATESFFPFVKDPCEHLGWPGNSEPTGGKIRINACHGVEEEIRADFVPLVTAQDRYGKTVGYPGIMLKNYAGALTTGNYRGSRWFQFLFNDPLRTLSVNGWKKLLNQVYTYCNSGIYSSRLKTEYASYRKGERVRISCRVSNKLHEPVCFEVKFKIYDNCGNCVETCDVIRMAVNSRDDITIETSWLVPQKKPQDYYQIKAELYKEERDDTPRERYKKMLFVESINYGLVVIQPEIIQQGPKVQVKACRVVIEGQDGFFTGTHYCGTNSFYEWMWYDFQTEIVKREMKILKKQHLKLQRIYTPPVLNEIALRAMDAFIQLCRQNQIAVEIILFSQWTKRLGIEIDGKKEYCEFRFPDEQNMLSMSFRNIEFQQRYTSLLAKRYKDVPGLIWNVANEGALLNVPKKQLAKASWLDNRYRDLKPPYNSINLCQQWFAAIIQAIKKAHAPQPVISAYTYTWANGDSYFINKLGDIGVYHDYSPQLQYAMHEDLTCCDKPLFLEEIGINTLDHTERLDHYDAIIHSAIGLRFCGVCVYEYGVSWLIPELPFETSNFIYYTGKKPENNVWANSAAKNWPPESVGQCSYAASFLFGMMLHCTGLPSPAAKLVAKLSVIGRNLGYHPKTKTAYLIVPMEFTRKIIIPKGHKRKTDFIETIMHELHQYQVDYGIVQEDMIHTIPETAKMLMIPNESRLKNPVSDLAKKFRQVGKEVYIGKSVKWKNSSQLPRIKVVPSNKISVTVRDLDKGKLYVLTNHTAQFRKFILTTESGNQVKIKISKFGMIGERNGKIFLVESSGSIEINDKLIADSGNKRYFWEFTEDNEQNLKIIPIEPMQLKIFSPELDKIELLDYNGQVVDPELAYKTRGNAHILNISPEQTDYILRCKY